MTKPFKPSLPQEVCRYLYSLALLLVVPVFLLLAVWQTITGNKLAARRQFQRCGFLPRVKKKQGILVHCVSVGEVVTAAKLLKVMLQQQPDLVITITTTTATGAEQVQKTFADSVQHLYLPYDLPFNMARLLNKLQPSQVLVTEVELWPNMIHACWRRNIPVTIINARMTNRSVRSYQKISALFQPMLHKLKQVCAQGQRDFDNYQALDIPREKLFLSGNIKFDLQLTTADQQRAQQLKQTLALPPRPIFIAGSTHDPEEQLLLEAYKTLSQQSPDLLLILVPRHPQRFEKVYQLCQQFQFKTVRMSQNQSCQADTQIILGDTLGQLNSLYALADFAYIGGSIADRGGHNPLEASIHGLPVMMGPHIYNNPEICQVLADAQVLFSVNDTQEITQMAHTWLDSAEVLEQLAQQAKSVVAQYAGAVANTLKRL